MSVSVDRGLDCAPEPASGLGADCSFCGALYGDPLGLVRVGDVLEHLSGCLGGARPLGFAGLFDFMLACSVPDPEVGR